MEFKDIISALLVAILLIVIYKLMVTEKYGAQSRYKVLKKMMGEGMAGNNIYAGTKYDMYQ
jgi:hypothetical protein